MHKDNESNSGSNPGHGSNYLIVRPHRGGYRDLFWYGVKDDETSKAKFLERPENREWSTVVFNEEAEDHRWVIVVSILVRKIIRLLRTPMEYTGFFVDFLLNLLSANGGFFGLLLRLIQVKVVIPERGSVTFVSTIGQLDGRIGLYKEWSFVEHLDGIDYVNSDSSGRVKIELGSRGLMDLCVMASKLAYENAKVVENVVDIHWKMNLVEFLDCWNDYQQQMSTQVFIFTDKPKDAYLIVISFRGTEPFDADDWGTDFDYSWFEIPNVGKLHMGFLEAIGLGNRDDTPTPTFRDHLLEPTSSEEENHDKNLLDMGKRSAYYAVRIILKRLLPENENAQFVVTGHSLGGALAILFPIVLVLKEETEIMKRLLGVYTFGQPRIGNREVGLFMKDKLNQPVDRYFRVVYCNDLVPRLPYDDKTFLYKHFGLCLYYDSFYNETSLPFASFTRLRSKLGVELPPTHSLQGSISTEEQNVAVFGFSNKPKTKALLGSIKPKPMTQVWKQKQRSYSPSSETPVQKEKFRGDKEEAVARVCTEEVIKLSNRFDALDVDCAA